MRVSLSLLLSLWIVKSWSQEYSGTWKGKFHSDMYSLRRTFDFTIQLQQNGRAVWGTYSTGSGKETDCLCTITGQLPKKDRSALITYRDKVIEYPESKLLCEFMYFLELNYKKIQGKEFLTGKWFGQTSSRYRGDDASGSFVVEKVSTRVSFPSSEYFPKLDQMINKYNKGEKSIDKTPNKAVL